MSDLIFVYNAKSGVINGIFDIGHKLFSPDTYSCDLCALTHSVFTESKEWKEFKNEFKGNLEFYHIDEFEGKFNQKNEYPVIFAKGNHSLNVIADSHKISEFKDIGELIDFIKQFDN